MGLLAEILLSFVHKDSNSIKNKRANFIFYKIVDSPQEKAEYTLQCINTSAIFRAKLADIVFDIDILYGLHPIQACYIGIEYAKYLEKMDGSTTFQNTQKSKFDTHSVCRYGNYNLHYQDRKDDVCFISDKTNEKFLMNPCDIALSEELIKEFDAAQAFYIGLLAGLKLHTQIKACNNESNKVKRPSLRIIK